MRYWMWHIGYDIRHNILHNILTNDQDRNGYIDIFLYILKRGVI